MVFNIVDLLKHQHDQYQNDQYDQYQNDQYQYEHKQQQQLSGFQLPPRSAFPRQNKSRSDGVWRFASTTRANGETVVSMGIMRTKLLSVTLVLFVSIKERAILSTRRHQYASIMRMIKCALTRFATTRILQNR